MTPDGAIRLLIVDDEPDIGLLLEAQFRLAGEVEVVGVAHDGGQAIELVRENEPDAVVMDLLMPGVNGFQAIDVLQREFRDVGIVAYTGVAGEFVRNEMDRRGVEVVLKTGALEPLADAVRRSVVAARGTTQSPG
jgi:DNA-binding NarL/FixJ family response regulator